jgi:hypothetical protein
MNGRHLLSGLIQEYPLPPVMIPRIPGPITTGADRNAWFGDSAPYSPVSPGDQPNSITRGPDGDLWFTDASGKRIGRSTADGAIAVFPSLDESTHAALR